MVRPKTKYDKEEVEEIIDLKLKELLGVKSKLTPNKVFTFNKKIAEKGSKYRRKNGEPFRLYGYHFWYTETEWGRQKIDEIKKQDDFILAGKSFKNEMQDIFILVDKFYKKPEELSHRLSKFFEKDRNKIKTLEKQNKELIIKVNELKEEVKKQKSAFLSIFMESGIGYNSLEDVISLKKSEDFLIKDELSTIMDNDFSQVEQSEKMENILNLAEKNNKKQRRIILEKEGL